MTNTTLYELVQIAVEFNDESVDDIELLQIDSENTRNGENWTTTNVVGVLKEFEGDTGFGAAQLPDVRIWTSEYVYYKEVYDGSERIDCVPRHPQQINAGSSDSVVAGDDHE